MCAELITTDLPCRAALPFLPAYCVQVLPEVLQQAARVDVPDAAKRKEYELRIKGEPPPLTPEERRRYRSNLHMVSGG